MHNIESSTLSFKISYVIYTYLLLTFIKCCNTLLQETVEIMLLCKYLNITFVSLFVSLDILSESLQVNKIVLGMNLVVTILQKVSESELEDITDKRIIKLMKIGIYMYYVSMCFITAMIFLVAKLLTEGTDWPIVYQFALFLCVTCYILTIFTAITVAIFGISHMKKWKINFESLMIEKMNCAHN